MAIIFPGDCITPAEQTEYSYRAQELLRLLHNTFGKWFREGLTQTEYDELPGKLKTKYEYTEKLSKKDWDKFQDEDFEPRSTEIMSKLIENRHVLFESTKWDVKVEDI